MKKSRFKKLLAVLLAAVLIACSFTGCAANGKEIMNRIYGLYNNLALGSTVTSQDGKKSSTFKLSGKAEKTKYATIDLGEEKEFNTVVLKESGKKVTLLKFTAATMPTAIINSFTKATALRAGILAFWAM